MFEFFDDYFDLYWDKKGCFGLNDKKRRTNEIVTYMLDRTNNAFMWEGLPKTIKPYILERYFQTFGNVCATEVTDIPENVKRDKGIYIFFGGLGGVLDENYEPTLYTIANPYLNYSANLNIGENCIRGKNDTNGIGLLPLFFKYASMMNENEISMNMLAICYRIDNLISADNDRTFESAKEYLDGIVDGQFGVISSTEFFEGIRNDKTTGSNKSIKDLIEYEQYIKASCFNEIGLNSNYNMKRERMVASESQMNDDALIPLIYDMLKNRKQFVDDMKEMFGDKYDLDNLTVSLNPIWDLDRQYVGMIPEDTNEIFEDTFEETDETTEEVTKMFDEDENPDGMTVAEMLEDLESNDPETEVEDISEPEETDNETETNSDSEIDSPIESESDETVETVSERLENIEEKIDELIEEVDENEIDETD